MRKCWPPLSIHQSGHSLCSPRKQRITQYLTGRNVEKTPPIPEEQRQQILALYQGTSLLQPKRCDFYAHVMLPPHYIPRPEIVAEVRASLLTTTSTAKPTVSRRTHAVALHGMGGIGKTVIARVLCEEPTVQAAFPDGILWASLGKNARSQMSSSR